MKRKLFLSSALFLSNGLALTTTQRETHINQILSAMGAVVVNCPNSFDSNYKCAKISVNSALAVKSWDLYADWDEKVTNKASHLTPWKQDKETITGTFKTADGDFYAVAAGPINGETLLATLWKNESASSLTVASGTGANNPSKIVSIDALPTRVGPLLPSSASIATEDIYGPVKQFTTKSFDMVNTNGNLTEKLISSSVRLYDSKGRVLKDTSTDSTGKIISDYTNDYQGDKLIRRDVYSKDSKSYYIFEYNSNGDLISSSHFDNNDAKIGVARFQAMPNGSIGEDYEKEGGPVSKTFTLQDKDGRNIDSEIIGKSFTIRLINVFDNGEPVTKSILTGLIDSVSEYKDGHLYSITTSSKLTGKSTDIFSCEDQDKYLNCAKVTISKSTVEFGEAKLNPKSVKYQEFVYH